MKQIKAFGPGDLRVVDVPTPVPGKGEVLIKVRANGICGSDKWIWNVTGYTERVPGHEMAGEIVALGEDVKLRKIGDRVTVNATIGCGKCQACREGSFVKCATRDGSLVEGGYGEYVVAPERNTQLLDDHISFLEGALIMDNWGTPYNAIRNEDIGPGSVVVVTGLGPIGQAAVGICAALDATVIAVDPVEYRREYARKMGAKEAIASGEDMVSFIKEYAYGEGADYVIECSGHHMSYENGLKSLRIGGTFLILGEHAEYRLKPSEYVIPHFLTIKGSLYATLENSKELQQMTLDGTIDPMSTVTHTLKLEEVPEFFGKIVACSDGVMKVAIVFD